jgi:alcohol dehydrogenase YqhD (iron-dependent ADH family)
MNSFIYDIPTRVYFGENQLGNLGTELKKYGKKVLLAVGGGSEMDAGGVISNPDTKEKLGLIFPSMQPKVSFLDPTNTYTVSARQTACGAADM